MLVLTRKEGDKIQIGLDVTIEAVRIHGNRVRLGVTAPDDVRVVRAEVVDSEDREQPE
jgi:carbon storage regulator